MIRNFLSDHKLLALSAEAQISTLLYFSDSRPALCITVVSANFPRFSPALKINAGARGEESITVQEDERLFTVTSPDPFTCMIGERHSALRVKRAL